MMFSRSNYPCPMCNDGSIAILFYGQPDECDVDFQQFGCDCNISLEEGDALIEQAMQDAEPDLEYILDSLDF